MKKKIVTAAVAVALAATMSVSAFAAAGSPVGGVQVDDSTVTIFDEKTGAETTETIRTATDVILDSEGNVVDLDSITQPVVRIITVSQAVKANAAVGTAVGGDKMTNNGRTVAQNKHLIAENAKTAEAKTTEEALGKVQSGLAATAATALNANVNSYAQAQTLEVVFNKAAAELAAKNNGITITLYVAGAKEGSKGFIQYYDANGAARIIVVTYGNNGRVSFKLPNASIIRTFVAAPQAK